MDKEHQAIEAETTTELADQAAIQDKVPHNK